MELNPIVIGIVFLFLFFLSLWALLVRYEKGIKNSLKGISAFYKKLQLDQFYLQKIFYFFHLKLSPKWIFGLPLIFVSLVFIVFSWLFGVIAREVIARDFATISDAFVNRWFYFHTSETLTNFMVIITDLGAYVTTFTIYLFLVFLLARKKLWYDLIFLSIAVPGEMLINQVMKMAFQRQRPNFHLFFSYPMDYSFPSGHTMNAIVLYGFMAIFALQFVKMWRWQVLIVLSAAFVVILVALSRVYLGFHYLSDTLGAIAIGFAWLSLCFIMTIALKQMSRATH